MTTQIELVDIARKFDLFTEPWHPKIIGELNESFVKIARLKGEFIWHQHEAEDELFLVIKGILVIKLRDREITVRPGQFVIIPKGMEHLPIADEEVHVLLLEPKTTLNTGSANSDRTVEAEWI